MPSAQLPAAMGATTGESEGEEESAATDRCAAYTLASTARVFLLLPRQSCVITCSLDYRIQALRSVSHTTHTPRLGEALWYHSLYFHFPRTPRSHHWKSVSHPIRMPATATLHYAFHCLSQEFQRRGRIGRRLSLDMVRGMVGKITGRSKKAQGEECREAKGVLLYCNV
jgi:hypothetical protein